MRYMLGVTGRRPRTLRGALRVIDQLLQLTTELRAQVVARAMRRSPRWRRRSGPWRSNCGRPRRTPRGRPRPIRPRWSSYRSDRPRGVGRGRSRATTRRTGHCSRWNRLASSCRSARRSARGVGPPCEGRTRRPGAARSPRRRRCGPSSPSTSCTPWPVGAVGPGRPPRGRPACPRRSSARA